MNFGTMAGTPANFFSRPAANLIKQKFGHYVVGSVSGKVVVPNVGHFWEQVGRFWGGGGDRSEESLAAGAGQSMSSKTMESGDAIPHKGHRLNEPEDTDPSSGSSSRCPLCGLNAPFHAPSEICYVFAIDGSSRTATGGVDTPSSESATGGVFSEDGVSNSFSELQCFPPMGWRGSVAVRDYAMQATFEVEEAMAIEKKARAKRKGSPPRSHTEG